jgi:hypothetical protein
MAKEDLQIEEGADEEDQGAPLDPEEGGEEKEAPFTYDPMAPNLVEDFMAHPDGRAALRRIAMTVIEDKQAVWEASAEYREKQAADWKIFSGNLPAKTFPFKDAANMNVPIMLENITRLCFRAESELFANWNSIVVWSPLGPEDEEAAKLLTLHNNWQFRVQIPDFKRQMSRGILHFFGMGDVTTYSWWDVVREQNRHEVVTCDEFLTPFAYVSTMPDYSDVPFRVLIRSMYRHELEAMEGHWYDVEKVLEREKPSWEEDDPGEMQQAMVEVQGMEKPEGAGSAPYKLLQYEGWVGMPKPDGQDDKTKQRFCRVVVDEETRGVLELMVLEEENWQDRARFDQQTQELEQYRALSAQYEQQLAEHQSQVQQVQGQVQELQGSGNMGPMAGEIAQQHLDNANSAQAQLAPPPPPAWMKNPLDPEEQPLPAKMEPVHMFAHQVCIEPIVGTYGISYGRIQADFNRAANTALSQFTDSATLANVWVLITANGIEFEKGFSWTPGAVNAIKQGSMSGAELKNNIIELHANPANPQLMDVVEKAYTWAQSSVQAPAVLSGESGKSGETFRGLSARIEQATKQLSVPTRKFADHVEQIARNNARLNRTFMKDEELFSVAEGRGETLKEHKIGRTMYERNYHVEVRADLRFVSESQKIHDADEVVGMGQKAMPTNTAFLWRALKEALLQRDLGSMVSLLGPEPPPPATTLGIPPPPPPGTVMPGQPVTPPAAPPGGQAAPPLGHPPPHTLPPPHMGEHHVAHPPGLPGPGGQPPPPNMGPLP